VVHGSTFGKNDLAMAAGIATLDVIDDEDLIGHAARMGEALLADLKELGNRHQFVAEVRGKGMMIGIAFGPPKSLTLRAGWELLERASPGLFCQMVTIPLFRRHRILSQVAGHGLAVVKLLPPLSITDQDRAWIRDSFDDVIAECHRLPGGTWDLARTLAGAAIDMARTRARA
jgi:ornithine--oxo-acid transaminase